MAKVISHQEWKQVQQIELATWTPAGYKLPDGKVVRPYPDLPGKIAREREYQKALLCVFRISGIAGWIVDVGCGPSPILEQIEGNFLGIGVDPLIPEYAKYHNIWAWQKTLPLVCTAESIRLPSVTVHHVICTNSLDHFQDPRQALAEMIRILRPGGTLWLSFCIENASKGHPHPAHKIDLTPQDVMEWTTNVLECERGEIIEYGWRKQPAWLGIYRKLALRGEE